MVCGVNVLWCDAAGWRLWGGSHFVCVTWWNSGVFDHLTLCRSVMSRPPSICSACCPEEAGTERVSRTAHCLPTPHLK